MCECFCALALSTHLSNLDINHISRVQLAYCKVMDADDFLLLTVVVALLKKKKKRKHKRRRMWMKEWFKKRNEFTHENLLKELRESSTVDYGNFLRMDVTTYEELLSIIGPKISKQNTKLRDAIPPGQRLSVCLRYLATGNSFEDLKFTSAISPQSISCIVVETCEAIITSLKNYIKVPKSEEQWKTIAEEFYISWNFPNCLGAIDGKHIAIKKPANSGSLYFNYKKYFSIVLMAVVNANYEFLVADVGINGRISDGGVLKHTAFGRALESNSLKIPKEGKLPCSQKVLPFVFVGDNAFQMQENFMKPYAHLNLNNKERIFNYRLSRARRIVENVFGILVSRFGVMQTTIALAPEKAQIIVLAACYLHNFLRSKKTYITNDLLEREDILNGAVINASWRSNNTDNNLEANIRNSSKKAKHVRDLYADYFLNEGNVPWQNKYLQ